MPTGDPPPLQQSPPLAPDPNPNHWETWVNPDSATANLGVATTEELYRELIARDSHMTRDDVGNYRRTQRLVVLAETLGGLSAVEREYRTVDS